MFSHVLTNLLYTTAGRCIPLYAFACPPTSPTITWADLLSPQSISQLMLNSRNCGHTHSDSMCPIHTYHKILLIFGLQGMFCCRRNPTLHILVHEGAPRYFEMLTRKNEITTMLAPHQQIFLSWTALKPPMNLGGLDLGGLVPPGERMEMDGACPL